MTSSLNSFGSLANAFRSFDRGIFDVSPRLHTYRHLLIAVLYLFMHTTATIKWFHSHFLMKT